MRVAITGATGFVAKNLRRRLSDLRICSVSRRMFRPLAHEEAVTTDYSSHEKLASDIQDCDVLVHLAGIGEGGSRSVYEHVNVDLTSAVVSAAKSAKIMQIIFLSGLGVSNSNPSDYFASKLRAERIIRASGIGHTIFRPSFILGADDYLTRLLDRQIRTGKLFVPGDGKYVLQPISIHDVTKIIRSSLLNKKFLNRTFDLVGPQTIAFGDFAKLYCEKRPAKVSTVPLEACLRDVFSNKRPLYTMGILNLFYGGYVGNFAKLQRAYGGPIRAVRDFL